MSDIKKSKRKEQLADALKKNLLKRKEQQSARKTQKTESEQTEPTRK